MTLATIGWAFLGLCLGAGHVWLLRRAALAGPPRMEAGVLRLLLSGGGLVAIAWMGGVLPGAAGWAAGFAGALAASTMKDSSCRRSKSSATR